MVKQQQQEKKQTLFEKIRTAMVKAIEKKEMNTKVTPQNNKRNEWLMRQQQLRQQQILQTNGSLSSNNKFLLMLNRRKAIYDTFEASRKRNELPKGYDAAVDRLKQLELKRRSDYGKSNSLLKAHENMHNVTMDFSDTRGNILTAPNTFSTENPASNIFRPSGRPNILQTEESILKQKHNLKF